MTHLESLYLHAFNTVPGFGPLRLIRLCQYFKNPAEAFYGSPRQLTEAGIEPGLAELCARQCRQSDLDGLAEDLNREGIKLLCFYDSAYPKLLSEIAKPPALLYYKGTMETADELCISVVGTRKISAYGRTVIPYLIEPIASAGTVIVSGLAYGVDTAVQKIPLEKGKRTIAIVGNGLDGKSFYPKEHQFIADDIVAKGGAVLSEYPPGTPPLKHHFLARNRIISGISVATVVVECDLKSGSLITARYALEQNRAVYAVPGPIYAQTSRGPNNLIKMGAKPLTDAKDILEDLNLVSLPKQLASQSTLGDSLAEQQLLDLFASEPISVNQLIKQSGIPAGEVTAALTFLELKGKIRNLGGQQYTLSR